MKKNTRTQQKMITVPTLSSDSDEIYAYHESPIPTELAEAMNYKSPDPFNLPSNNKLLHIKLRETVLNIILPNILHMMESQNDVDVILDVETKYQEATIKIVLSSYNYYAIISEGNEVIINSTTRETSNGYYEIGFNSKVALIHYISMNFARAEFRILLRICEYYEELNKLHNNALKFTNIS